MLEGHSSSADLCRQATQAVPPLAAGLCLAGEMPKLSQVNPEVHACLSGFLGEHCIVHVTF